MHYTKETEDLIRIIISDNGKGFDLEKKLNHPSKPNHALHILNERITLLKKESNLPLSLKTSFKNDLFEVTICIPKIKKL